MKPIVIRISNVLAWIGFAYLVGSFSLVFVLVSNDNYGLSGFLIMILGLSLPWLACLVINYIMIGSLRVLPWKRTSDSSDQES